MCPAHNRHGQQVDGKTNQSKKVKKGSTIEQQTNLIKSALYRDFLVAVEAVSRPCRISAPKTYIIYKGRTSHGPFGRIQRKMIVDMLLCPTAENPEKISINPITVRNAHAIDPGIEINLQYRTVFQKVTVAVLNATTTAMPASRPDSVRLSLSPRSWPITLLSGAPRPCMGSCSPYLKTMYRYTRYAVVSKALTKPCAAVHPFLVSIASNPYTLSTRP